MILMDDGGVVAIIWHKAILEEEWTKHGVKVLWFFRSGGYRKGSKLKDFSLLAMFGWRWAQDFYMWNNSFMDIENYYHLWWFFF